MAKTVLIVEDERAIVEILKFNLKREGYETLEALDGQTGLLLAQTEDPDLILLDVMLPKMNGFDICKTLRAENRTTPIIMLTAREEEMDKVFGLETGADDYMTKPFNILELKARVKALLKRASGSGRQEKSEEITVGALTLDQREHVVRRGETRVELTAKEYDLLELLMKHPRRVYSREVLMNVVWGYEYQGDFRTVDVHVRRLREKIEENPAQPEYILTKWGVGYYFKG